jgi:hypothetical protein
MRNEEHECNFYLLFCIFLINILPWLPIACIPIINSTYWILQINRWMTVALVPYSEF